MKQLTIYNIGAYYLDNKIAFVKLIKDTTGLGLKETKDITDDVFSKFRNNPGEPIIVKLEYLDDVAFIKNASNTITCDIRTCSSSVEPKVTSEKDSFAIALDTIRKGLYESHKLRQEIDQLKQINHELTKEIRSLKSTLYKTAVDLNKHYQATSNLMNYSGPRAAHIIKDLANDIRENDEDSAISKEITRLKELKIANEANACTD